MKNCLYFRFIKWYLKRLNKKDRFERTAFVGKRLLFKQERLLHERD
jgi:hypothetical protein